MDAASAASAHVASRAFPPFQRIAHERKRRIKHSAADRLDTDDTAS